MPQQFLQNSTAQFGPERLSVGWPWRFFTASFAVFLISVLVYFGLVFGYGPFLEKRIAEKEQQIADSSAVISKEAQDKFSQLYSQIINLKSILDNHVFPSSVIALLERTTHPKVYFIGLNFKAQERELELDGIAANFNVLAEQLESYSQADGIEGYTLTQSQFSDNSVQFKAVLKLSKSLLVPEKLQ